MPINPPRKITRQETTVSLLRRYNLYIAFALYSASWLAVAELPRGLAALSLFGALIAGAIAGRAR